MKPEELLTKLNNVFPYSRGQSVAEILNNMEKQKLELIQKAKSEWCKEQRRICFDEAVKGNAIFDSPEPD